MVLCRLTRKLFEPLATCDLHVLTSKTAFLLAITLGRKVSELSVLCATLPFLTFLPHAMQLTPDITFLPKVVSEFHLQFDILPDFYPSPASDSEKLLQTLVVKRALLFYLKRTGIPGRDYCLFVSYSPKTLGHD